MKLCEFSNHTFVAFDYTAEYLISVKGRNEVIGVAGECMQKFLFVKKEFKRCRIIGHRCMGIKLPNNTYTGILGLLQSKQVDLFLRSEPQYLYEIWLKQSIPTNSERIVITHSIKNQNNDQIQYFDLISNFEFGFSLLSMYLMAFLSILIFSFLINEIIIHFKIGLSKQKELKISRRIALILNNFSIKKLSSIGMFVLFVRLFFWINQLFIINNIKTNKVVVDTSDLIKTSFDIFNTQRTACFVDNEQEVSIASTSPVNNLLSRIYREKIKFGDHMIKERKLLKNEKCLINLWDQTHVLEHLRIIFKPSVFLVAAETYLNFLLAFLSQTNFLKKKIILNQIKIHEFNSVFYFNLRHSFNEIYFKEMSLSYSAFGFLFKTFSCMNQQALTLIHENDFKLFKSVSEFIDDNAHFSDLVFNNFRTLLLLYFLNCLFILVIFCLHHQFKVFKKWLVIKMMNFWINLKRYYLSKFSTN